MANFSTKTLIQYARNFATSRHEMSVRDRCEFSRWYADTYPEGRERFGDALETYNRMKEEHDAHAGREFNYRFMGELRRFRVIAERAPDTGELYSFNGADRAIRAGSTRAAYEATNYTYEILEMIG